MGIVLSFPLTGLIAEVCSVLHVVMLCKELSIAENCNGHFTISVIESWGTHSDENSKPGGIVCSMHGFTSHNKVNEQLQGNFENFKFKRNKK